MATGEWLQPLEQQILDAPFSAGGILNAGLLRLLAHRTERYTMGESSSVTVEKASELLKSIFYTLDLGCRTQGKNFYALPDDADLNTLLLIGQAEIENRMKTGKEMLEQALMLLGQVEDVQLRETLSEIGQFFRRYDVAYFAHDIPCAIDYILENPISEELQGIDYINAYLTELIAEGSAVPLARMQEEERLNALMAQQAMQHTDGELTDDDKLRALIARLADQTDPADKADTVMREIRSLRDMVEVLDVCFWGEEALAVFKRLKTPELALLYRFACRRPTQQHAPGGWEKVLTGFIGDMIGRSR